MVFQERQRLPERQRQAPGGGGDAPAAQSQAMPQYVTARGPAPWDECRPAVNDRRALASIGEVARRFGVTLRTLRFYESKGLIHPLRDGYARYYDPRDLVRIELILKGKQLGFTLAEIISMLGDGRAQVTELMVTPQQALAQIAHLEQQQRAIEAALADLRKRYYLMSEQTGT